MCIWTDCICAYLWHFRDIFVVATWMVIAWKIKVSFFFTCMWSNVRSTCRLHHSITWPKYHVVPHFIHFDPRNTRLPLQCCLHHAMLVPLSVVSQDQKVSCCNSFQLSLCKGCSGAIENTVAFTGWHHWCQWYQWQIRHATPHFGCYSAKECIGTIHDTISITWHWYQHQWHHMTKNYDVPHFSWRNLRNALVPLMMLFAAYDTGTGINGTKFQKHYWHHIISRLVAVVLHEPKSPIAPHFDHFDRRNALVPLMVLSTSPVGCHHITATTMPGHYVRPMLMLMASYDEKSCWISFQLS